MQAIGMNFNSTEKQIKSQFVNRPWLSEIRVDSRLSLTGTVLIVLSELYERLDVQLIELRVSEIGCIAPAIVSRSMSASPLRVP